MTGSFDEIAPGVSALSYCQASLTWANLSVNPLHGVPSVFVGLTSRKPPASRELPA